MAEFAVGDVVRHRVGGDWRGVVIAAGSGGHSGAYLVRSRGGSGFVTDWLYSIELEREPPSSPPPEPMEFAPLPWPPRPRPSVAAAMAN